MLTKQEKEQLRGNIFRHLDGIATSTTAYALHNNGVLDYLLDHKKVSLNDLCMAFNANDGYLNVALRILCSQGWLIQHLDNAEDKVFFEVNDNSKVAFELVPLYEEVVHLLNYAVRFPDERIGPDAFIALERIFKKHERNFGLTKVEDNSVEQQILKHIEGVIVAPIIVMLGLSGLFHKYFMEASFRAQEFHKDPESFKKILDFFFHLGWFKKKKDTYQFTEKGLFYAKRASAYGVTISYLPTFLNLEELIFGNPMVLKTSSPDDPEKHVHREMNVWGSGGAHSTYFKVIDDIIITIFNKPLNE